MRDFFYVNILNEGMIPWIMERGPLFAYYTSAGVYSLLARDPRVEIEITDKALAERRKSEYIAKKNKAKAAVQQQEKVIVKDEVKIQVESKNPFVEPVINDVNDDEIDAILSQAPQIKTEMKGDIKNAEVLTIDADGERIYSDKELEKMTKKQLKDILESRGHAAGQRFVKTDDPFSPMYHDSVEDLREKVRKSQQTF